MEQQKNETTYGLKVNKMVRRNGRILTCSLRAGITSMFALKRTALYACTTLCARIVQMSAPKRIASYACIALPLVLLSMSAPALATSLTQLENPGAPSQPTPADTLENKPAKQPVVALKNNLLYDAILTPNLSLEVRLAKHWTLQFDAGFNPFPLDDKVEHKWRHVAAGIEAKYWFRNAFACDFIGVNAFWSHYNVAKGAYPLGWLYPAVKDYRFQGDAVGGGISYGWHFPLSKHVGIELEAGVDGGYTWFDRYECPHCGALLDHQRKWFALPKLGVNIAIVIPGDEDRGDDCPCRKKKASSSEEEGSERFRDVQNGEEVLPEIPEQPEQPTPAEDYAKADESGVPSQPTTADTLENLENSSPNVGEVAQSAGEVSEPSSPAEQAEPEAAFAVAPWLAAPIVHSMADYAEYTRDQVLSKDSDVLYVMFPLDSSLIEPAFANNALILDSIVHIVRALRQDPETEMKVIQIVGFASPDGNWRRNERLAGNRAEALKDYIQQHVDVPDSLFEVYNGGEAWSELAWEIEQSDYKFKNQVLRIIREEKNPTRRELRLREHNYGWTFVYLRDTHLSSLRNAGYVRVYVDKKEKGEK